MPPTTPPKAAKGLHCPVCQAHRLCVRETRQICPGVKVRYRVCTACGTVVKTREVVVKIVARSDRPR